jgi:hypothetical protein
LATEKIADVSILNFHFWRKIVVRGFFIANSLRYNNHVTGLRNVCSPPDNPTSNIIFAPQAIASSSVKARADRLLKLCGFQYSGWYRMDSYSFIFKQFSSPQLGG